MKRITVFDTSISTDNLGDEIIMEAVMEQLRELYPHDFMVRVPTHDRIGKISRNLAKKSDLSFVGGTNILSANWLLKSQWKIGLCDFWRLGNPILMGVGWQFYQRMTTPDTVFILKHLLCKKQLHSVRDSYTQKRVREMGIQNVINTACPTMWGLTAEHCAAIPARRAANALITVTAYRHDPALDKQWIDIVLKKYGKVYFWPQMFDDLAYIQAIAPGRIIVLDASVAAYDKALATLDVDYIGTRLHGGIRALQHQRRAMILEVDNRATEIARDTGLLTMKRDDVQALTQWIEASAPTKITLPLENIARWKAQFS